MRKVLSFVLVLTLVLSSFSMAFAATPAASLTDIAGNANEDAIQVNYDLGIVTGNPDGTFLPAKAVNRAEFAAMLTRALAIPDSALAGYTATSFKDTAGYGWAVPYLAFCQSKGILLGDGAGNVMPGRTITVNEAMTMALRAIGYTANSALLVGAWPSNYVSIAQNSDLYDSVAKTTTVDKANAAQIIYNLLTVQKVAVNSDGSTDMLWIDGDEDEGALNLLNSNLDCDAYEDEILGSSGYGYDDSIINITDDLGAYGDAYLNSDDELVAFTKSSTALTGKLNDDKDGFEVGDVTYNIDNSDNEFVTDGAYFINGEYVADDDADLDGIIDDTDGQITVEDIASFAAVYADDGDTVTLNVDLSGKTIKDIYSCVGWLADDKSLADSTVQEDITDDSAPSLSDFDFATTDDDTIDYNSFELVGVPSLDKIAEDNVVYVYAEGGDPANDIRKIAVGTETVEGVIDEIDGDAGDPSTLTIGGKDYDVSALATDDAKGVDVDDEGTFYIDAFGEIYDYDGTSQVNTYGIVKAWDASSIRNFQVKLYTSEDATTTFSYADDPEDIDWTTDGGVTPTQDAVTVTGAMIGYSVDKNGDIDTIDNTYVTYAAADVDIQSKKVITIDGDDYDIDSKCVILTYGDDFTDPQDVATVADLETGAAADDVAVIFNEDGDAVIAMYLQSADATTYDDMIYGVINSRTTAKNADGDKVYKYKGFIDGTEFTYLTGEIPDADVTWNAGEFSVYGFELDSADAINKITDLSALEHDSDDPTDGDNGWTGLNVVIDSMNSDKTVITEDVTGNKYTIDDDAVVYKYDAEDEEFTVSKLSSLREGYTVSLFDTKGDDVDGSASVVIFQE